MKRARWMLGTLALLLAACGGTSEEAYRFTRFAMGTTVEYTIRAPSHDEALAAMLDAHAEVERVARLLWEEDSLSQTYRLNHATESMALDPEAFAFLTRLAAYHARTGGAFDATIKPVLDLYDFDAETPTPPDEAVLGKRLRMVGMEHLRLAAPDSVTKAFPQATVVVGGVAKGYAVDRAVDVLRDRGIHNALVNAGGDLYALGTNQGRPWTVGIRHPDDPNALLDTLYVTDRAVATSGDYQRFFIHEGRRYHHLLDPATGRPARRARSATVLASTTEEADALATGLFVAGPEGLAFIDSLAGVDGMIVDVEGEAATSRDYPSFRSRPGGSTEIRR